MTAQNMQPGDALAAETLQAVRAVAEIVRREGGRALLVGGCVRDALLGIKAKDVDIEAYGVEADRLESALSARFKVSTVGRAFGVLKLGGGDIDVSLPRRESKQGAGHKGFAVEGDPGMSVEEAAARRDFTVNAILCDPLTQELIDPLGGRADLERRRLRHCGPQFSEDPLRVLRGMQFVARFELTADAETVELCRGIEPEGLPAERLFEEWAKLILKGARPSLGLEFLRAVGWTRHCPELEALIGCEQDPEWHPEGDVWAHTLCCMDAFAASRIGDEQEDLIVGFATLCHDFGKPETTVFERGRWRAPLHESRGREPARRFMERLTRNRSLIDAVIPLVTHHMRPMEYYKTGAGDAAVRRLAANVGRIDRLVRVAEADQRGRPPREHGGLAEIDWLLSRAEELRVKDSAPKPIVMGRHLIDRGWSPGRHFKKILDACYEAQLDGAFEDLPGGLAYLDSISRNG